MDKENEKADTIESKEDVDSSVSSESDPGFVIYNMPDYSSCDMPKIEFNAEDHSSIDKALDLIKTPILSRHAIATFFDPTVETLGKYSPYDLEEMYRHGLNDGMKRAVEPDSPLIEQIVKRAMDKLSKSKEIELAKTGEWIIVSMSLDLPDTDKIKYKCSNCETEYTRTIFLRELPKYCENCGSKNSVRHDPDKISW